jgi:hypothetical protein
MEKSLDLRNYQQLARMSAPSEAVPVPRAAQHSNTEGAALAPNCNGYHLSREPGYRCINPLRSLPQVGESAVVQASRKWLWNV